MTAGVGAAASATLEETRHGCEVVVRGRLDVHTVADLRARLHDVLDRGEGAGAEVGDATGLGVIVGVHHRARQLGRRLVLVDVSPRLDRLLRASRLNRVLARSDGVDAETTVVPLTA